jgi:2-methylisocitrate lyase-like PEP mutase family enzyme
MKETTMENNRGPVQKKLSTRRDFLVRTNAGAVAFGLLSVPALASNPAAEPQNQGGARNVRTTTPAAARVSQGKKLRDLLARKGVVLVVLGTPDAGTAQAMDAAGVEAAFIGTGITMGRYTALGDEGVITATESLWAAKFIAESVNFPLILDGDTGHGGTFAVRRLVRECIKIGLAGIRIDDQEIEAKRGTGSSGIVIVSREHAVERYQSAVKARNELDPGFVIMAQCYARRAVNGGMSELLARLPLYETAGGCDWVQFERPQSVEEIKQARAVVKGPFSAMQGDLPKALTVKEHLELGLNAKWATGWPNSVLSAAARQAVEDFKTKGPDFVRGVTPGAPQR